MLDSSNRHFNDPSTGSSRVDQKADIDTVIVLEAKLTQQTAPSRNYSAKRLPKICKFWKVIPKQWSRGKRRDTSGTSAEACLHKVRFIGKQRPHHAANQVLPQSAQIPIQIKQELRLRRLQAVLHRSALAQQGTGDDPGPGPLG